MAFDLSTTTVALVPEGTYPWAEKYLTEDQQRIWQRLLVWLDAGGDEQCRFDYKNWNCGTSACIGGWLEALFGRIAYQLEVLAEKVGLLPEEAEVLFFHGFQDYDRGPTTVMAASCVRHMLATGEVNWVKAWGEAPYVEG